MKKACIFDLDGTLLYTLDSMAKAGNQVLKQLGLPALPLENYKYYCGDGAAMLVRRILTDAGDRENALYDQAYPRYAELFGKDPLYKVEPFPDIKSLLSALKAEGIRLAVCSNKPHAATTTVIETLLPGFFDVCIGQQDPLRRKPYPDMPLEVARRLMVDPADCLYLGDSGTDMKTGKAAGMYTVGVLWGYRDLEELEENGADEVVFSPLDVLPIAKA